MDPFEVRMQFLSLLSRLTSSLSSIQKVSSFALKHSPRCSDDIWDCLVEECGQVSLNARINLLYFLDTLLEKSALGSSGGYGSLVKRDLGMLVEMVVPNTREGVLNLMSTNQVLKSWKTRRLLDADTLDKILKDLETRRASLNSTPPEASTSTLTTFSRNDILRRIEDDRERHKRLRERIWVLPVPSTLFHSTLNPALTLASTGSGTSASSTKTSPTSPSSPSESIVNPYANNSVKAKSKTLSTRLLSNPAGGGAEAGGAGPTIGGIGRGPELAIEIEFEQLWESSEEEMGLHQQGKKREWERKKRLWEQREEGEDINMEDPGAGEARKGKAGKTSGETGWPLSDQDRFAMRRERVRCGPS